MLTVATTAFGMSSLLRKMAVDKLHPFQIQVVSAAVYMTVFPVYVWLAAEHAEGNQWTWKGVGWGVAATLIASMGSIAFGFALRAGNDAGVVTSLSSVSPIITLMLSFLLLGERPSVWSAVGCALVLAGVALISFRG